MTPSPPAVRKTITLLSAGICAGIVTTEPALWAAGTFVGTLVGGLALPRLGWSVLRRVSPRRIALVVGAAAALILGSLLARPLPAQSPPSDPAGTWRGTSLCQVRPSACHDESVVYRITRTRTPDSLALDGRKIVGAEEVAMGVLGCRFEAAGGRLTCPIAAGVWLFTVRGDSLVGELRLADGTRVRDVRTRRSPQAHP